MLRDAFCTSNDTAKIPLTPASRERKLRVRMNSQTHNFANDGSAVRPTMSIVSTGVPSHGGESLREFVT
jgi:hypothetical protein